MKTMTCRQLGGASDLEFKGETFEQIAALSQQHGMDMFEQQDAAHLEAMQAMRALMHDPGAMQQWYNDRKAEFEALPDD